MTKPKNLIPGKEITDYRELFELAEKHEAVMCYAKKHPMRRVYIKPAAIFLHWTLIALHGFNFYRVIDLNPKLHGKNKH
jgi:hypothetical protein